MLIPSLTAQEYDGLSSLSRRVNANSQLLDKYEMTGDKLIKKGEC